jgi:hypothetical protein
MIVLVAVTLLACSGGGEGRERGSTLGSGPTDGSSEPGGQTESAGDTSAGDTSAGDTSAGGNDTSTGEPTETTEGSEYFMMVDPLVDGTLGVAVGGAFGSEGWTTTDRTDRLHWALPRLVTGSVEFTVTGLTIDLMPSEDNEIFAMYEGGWDIEHPINYNPEFRNNHYKSMIRIYGLAEVERIGQQKLMFGLCPAGAPGYIEEGDCACATSFFEEPFGGDPTWDSSPQRLRVEWDGSHARYVRNDEVVLEIDYGSSGLHFGPRELYASLGTSRPTAVDTASMPIGITFSDVVIEGWTGAEAICG